MTTLELFKKHRKGEVSRERFLYEVRRDNNLPWVTNTTSYDDAVKILKNKGIIREAQFEPQNITTDPAVDRANPYAVKREVQKLLSKEKELTNDSYKIALNKAAKKIAGNPQAIKDAMFSNADSVAKADSKLQTKEVKKNNFVDKDNGMKKIKGQEAHKAMSAPTKENRKGKPKGVKVMPDKGVEGSQKIIKEIAEYIKKKLAENSMYHEFHTGMEVETNKGQGVVKEINGGTVVVELHDGTLVHEQMNTLRHRIENAKEDAEQHENKEFVDEKQKVAEEYDEEETPEEFKVDNIVEITGPNHFERLIGIVEEVYTQNVVVRFNQQDIEDIGADYNEASFSKADVKKLAKDPEDFFEIYGYDWEENDEDYEEDNIAQQIKALEREKFQVIRDMKKEAEPEGGPIADDYADRLMDLERQIRALEAKLSIHEDELEEDLFKNPKTGAVASGQRTQKGPITAAGFTQEIPGTMGVTVQPPKS